MHIGIISVAPPFRGGIAAHTSQLIQVLSENHSVKCYNFTRQYPNFLFPGKTQYLEPKEYIDESIECLDSVNPISWFKVAISIKKEDFDVVIFRFWNPFFAPMLVTIARRIKRKNPNLKLISLFDNFLPHESQFYDKYFTNWLDTEVMVMYMKLYNTIKSQYLLKYDKELDKESVLFILREIIRNNESRKYVLL